MEEVCDESVAAVVVGPNVDKPDMHSRIDFGPGLRLQRVLLAQQHYRTMLRISLMQKQQVKIRIYIKI